MSTNTNANSNILATLIAEQTGGKFSSLIITKVGTERGPKGAKVRYGDDEILTVMYTGALYANLVERSLDALPTDAELATMLADATAKGIMGWSGRGKKATQVPLTLADFEAARDDLRASFQRTLDPNQASTSTTKHVYEPLMHDGKPVRGARVYKCVADDPNHECHCRNCTGDPKAPLPGTIYIQALHIWQKVLTPAPNGPKPASQSGAKIVAKGIIERTLPVRRYVSYRLEPGTDFILKVGGTARVEATTAGFVGTPELLAAIDKVA